MNVDWNDVLTLLNTADTVLALVILALAAERLAIWYGRLRRWLRRAKTEREALGEPRAPEASSDAAERTDTGEGL